MMVCTLIPIPKGEGSNRDAEIFNSYIYAYAKCHVRVGVLETAAKIKDVMRRRDWTELHHADGTHLDEQKGAYFFSCLINQSLDFYAMDKPSIFSGKIMKDQTDRTNRLQGFYIRDYNDFFRRHFMKLRAEARVKGTEIPGIRLQQRIVEPWIREIDGKPPYDANYTAEIPM